MKKNKKKKKFKIKFKLIFLFIIFSLFIYLLFSYLIKLPISNIFIEGNEFLTDQQIIEQAKIENYPPSLKNLSFNLEKRLEKNIYIKDAKVSKKSLTQVYIKIEENMPLFFNQATNKTVLLDGRETKDIFELPILINNIPDIIYDTFIKKMGLINNKTLAKVSEIKYEPDEVDDKRFLLTMTDSNYVYLTLNKLEKINNYNDIVKQFNNKKGILYLNSGGYFEIK